MLSETDKFLVNSIKKGDFKSFEIIFKSYYSVLCKYSFGIIDDINMAEDLVSDVMASIWETAEKIDIHTSLKSYLYKSVHNSSINYLKRQKHKFLELDKESLERINELLTWEESPSEKILNLELDEIIHKAMDLLPPECKKIFLLSRQEGLSHKEIAEKLNLSPNTVKVQIFRALSKIREILKKYT